MQQKSAGVKPGAVDILKLTSNRVLREKVRAESMYCVTLLDWRGALDAQWAAERFLAFFAQCGRTPSVWLISYGAGQKRISGK